MKAGTTLVFMAMIVVGMANVTFGYYNQSLGRWTSEDPLGVDPAGHLSANEYNAQDQYNDGLGLYSYAAQRPTDWGDAFGLADYVINGNIPPDRIQPRIGNTGWPVGYTSRQLRDLKKAAYGLAASWAALGHDDGAAFLRHFLGNTGWPRIADYTGMMRESPDGFASYAEELSRARLSAEELIDEDTTVTMTSRMQMEAGAYTPFNWYAAIGGHYTWGRARVTRFKCGECFRMNITAHISDRYDFDSDLNPMQVLERTGMARSFKVVGAHTVTLVWRAGYGWGTTIAEDLIKGHTDPYCAGR
jgi:hypothetical protein